MFFFHFRLSLDPTDSQHGTTVSQFSSVSQPTHTQIQQSRWEPKRRSYDQSHDQKQDGLDDTLTELDSFTLGAPAPVKRSDSGIGLIHKGLETMFAKHFQNFKNIYIHRLYYTVLRIQR